MDKELLMKEVYDSIDLCRLGSLDGEIVEMIVRPGKETGTRDVSIRLSNNKEVESFDFTFTNAELFDKETMKELTDYFLGEEEIMPVEEYSNPLVSDLAKVVVKTTSGNNILIETHDASSLNNDFFAKKVETVDYEPQPFNDIDKKVELALECAKGRLQLRDYIDEIGPEDKNTIIELVRRVGVKDLKEFLLTNSKDLPEKTVSILLQDLELPNPKIIPSVSLFLKNESRFEKYNEDKEFQELLNVAVKLSQKGYFSYSLDFPRGFLEEDLLEAENRVKKGSRNKYNFLREVEENFLKSSNNEEAFLVSKFKDYLVKKKQKSLVKAKPISLEDKKEVVRTIRKTDTFVDVNSFDDLKATLDLISGGKLDTEKMQLVIKNNSEDKNKREVSMFLKDGITKDTYNFRFNEGTSFDNEVLPEIVKYFISKEDSHEVEYRNLFGLNNYNLTTSNGNSLFISTGVDISSYLNVKKEVEPVKSTADIGIEVPKKEGVISNIGEEQFKTTGDKVDLDEYSSEEISTKEGQSIPSELERKLDKEKTYIIGRLENARAEVVEFYEKDALRRNGQLSPSGLDRISELVKSNPLVRELEDSSLKYSNGTFSIEDYNELYESALVLIDEKKKELVDGNVDLVGMYNDFQNEIKSANIEEVAEYYHSDFLRRNGQLPPIGLKRIAELAGSNLAVRALEDHRTKYLNNEISKEEYEADYEHYRDLFKIEKDILEVAETVEVGKDKVMESSLEPEKPTRDSIVETDDKDLGIDGLPEDIDVIMAKLKGEFLNKSIESSIIDTNPETSLPPQEKSAEEDRDINEAISEAIARHLNQDETHDLDTTKDDNSQNKESSVEVANDYQPPVTLLERISEAYEVASGYSTEETPAGLKIHHLDNEDNVEIIVANGMMSDEEVLFQEKVPTAVAAAEFANIVGIFVDNSQIAFNKEHGYNEGKKKNLVSLLDDGRFLQISNGSATQVDNYHNIIKEEMTNIKGEERAHGKN